MTTKVKRGPGSNRTSSQGTTSTNHATTRPEDEATKPGAQLLLDRLEGVKEVGRSACRWVALCPLHDDESPSLHLDVKLKSKEVPELGWGLFGYCTTCGGVLPKIIELFDLPKGRVFYEGNEYFAQLATQRSSPPLPLPSPEQLTTWSDYLRSDQRRMSYLVEHRGLSRRAIRRFRLGFDEGLGRYVVPVFDRADKDKRKVVNLRLYNPKAQKAKMINLRGHGAARLYPYPPPSGVRSVVVAEGEWDVLALRSQFSRRRRGGLSVVCSTAGAGTWKPEWNERFRGKHVTFVYDCDEAGRANAVKWARQLIGFAKSVRVVDLAPDRDDGYDLSDYFASGGTDEELRQLINAQAPLGEKKGKGVRS